MDMHFGFSWVEELRRGLDVPFSLLRMDGLEVLLQKKLLDWNKLKLRELKFYTLKHPSWGELIWKLLWDENVVLIAISNTHVKDKWLNSA